MKARKLLERAAEREIDAAQYALGKLYLSDDADVHDPAKGIYWLKRAADNGNDYAAYRLGKEYLSGKNVQRTLRLQRNTCGRPQTTEMLMHSIYWESCTSWARAFRKMQMPPTSGSRKRITAGHTYAGMFMDRIDRGEQSPLPVMLAATRLLYHMGNIFRDNAPIPAATGIQIDRKRLAQLRQKRIVSDTSRTIMNSNHRGIQMAVPLFN